MIQVNLIPEVKKQLIHAQYLRNRVILGSIVISIVAISVAVILSLYTFGYQAWANANLDTSITKESNEFLKVEDLSKMLTIQNQLAALPELNNSKKINSRFNDMINKINPSPPNTVQYNSVTIDSVEKTIVIEGQTTGFPAYETFKKTLSNAMVRFKDSDDKEQDVDLATDISIAETSFGVDSAGNQVLRFIIRFTYADEFLSPSSKDAVIIIASSGNVTDSYKGVPQSLFVDKAADIGKGQ